MPLQLTIKEIEGGKPGAVYYPLELKEVPKPTPGPNELLVKLAAAALNHRDLFIRQHLYPGIAFGRPLLGDGYGTVVEAGSACSAAARDLLHKPVLLTPTRGWESDPDGPEQRAFTALGGSLLTEAGTAQEYVVVPEDEVVAAPAHLSAAEGAALPLVGLTAWRALVTKTGGNAAPGRNILVTGIGGGVALQALQLAVAMGCNVWVTSGDEAKIDKARQLGARGGVLYKAPGWEKQLAALLPEERPLLDAVVDGAGGEVVTKCAKLLRPGGVISCYGMTAGPTMTWNMTAVLKNIELRGSTMGSKREFREMVAFVADKKIRPVVSRTVQGLGNLDGIEGLFDDMKHGKQFGKLVILIDPEGGSSPKL